MFGILSGNLFKGVYFNQPDGGGDSTEDGTGAGGDPDNKVTSPDGKNAGDDKKSPEKKGAPFTPEQQEYIEKVIIPERLKRAKYDADQIADKARKQAEEDALAKNQEFEKLATTRQTRVEELEKELGELRPFKDQADKYAAAITKIVDAQVEKLPEAVKVLVKKLEPLERMEIGRAHV